MTPALRTIVSLARLVPGMALDLGLDRWRPSASTITPDGLVRVRDWSLRGALAAL